LEEFVRRPFFLVLLFLSLPARATVTFDWVDIGDPGNTCDVQTAGCFGAAGYAYEISRYAVNNEQYAEFLNAVAATDPNNLFHIDMGPAGITRSGSSGSYSYSVAGGAEDYPVIAVSFYGALRFANWIHNGQPAGA
jgi:hypothetical protein